MSRGGSGGLRVERTWLVPLLVFIDPCGPRDKACVGVSPSGGTKRLERTLEKETAKPRVFQTRASGSLGSPASWADRFALELLLPEDLFRQYSQGLRPDFASVESLATRFRAGWETTAARFAELSSYRIM